MVSVWPVLLFALARLSFAQYSTDFTPKKIYAQTRKYDTVRHLPQTEALAEATTSEEAANAPRLREVLSLKKIQQVYEEKGYEDLGYDHAGYNHEGAKYEDVEKTKEGQSEGREIDESGEDEEEILAEIRERDSRNPSAESRSDTQPESRVVNDRTSKKTPVTFPGRYTTRQYTVGRPTDVYVSQNVRRPVFHGMPSITHHYILPQPFPTFFRSSAFSTPHPTPIHMNTAPLQFLNGADTLNAYASLIQARSTAPTPVERLTNSTDSAGSPSKVAERRPTTRSRFYNNFTRSRTPQMESGVAETQMPIRNPSTNSRHPSIPRDSGEARSDGSDSGPVKYVEQLTLAHFASTSANVPTQTPIYKTDRLRDLARQLNAETGRVERKKRNVNYDKTKYPFYDKEQLGQSALRYATNPSQIPKKTSGGMEFYESRDKLVRCSEPQPPNPIPKKDKDGEWSPDPVPTDLPRLKGIGESIDCFKVKYFGENPLDNPFFQEKLVRRKRRRPVQGSTKRLMIIPGKEDNYTSLINDTREDLPYNHRPDNAMEGQSLHDVRVPSPYQYYDGNNQYSSYFPEYYPPPETISADPAVDGDPDSSKRHKYYHGFHVHNYPHKKRKRIRPPYQTAPVSIYSIISSGHNFPFYRPVYGSGSTKVKRVIPVYELTVRRPTDSLSSEAGTKLYIVRPGEYTQNKNIALESKPSIWSYMNPLNWWSYFDTKRKELRYRKKRNAEIEIYKIGDNATPSTSTSPPMTISDFLRKNSTEKPKTRVSRLTGGFLSRVAPTTPKMEPASTTTSRPKVLFPRTKSPSSQRISSRKQNNGEINREPIFTATTSTTSTTTNAPTTRMYKPKRVLRKKTPSDAFSILRRPESAEDYRVTHRPLDQRRTTLQGPRTYVPDLIKLEDSRSRSEEENMSSEAGFAEMENHTLTYMVNPATGVGTWDDYSGATEPIVKKKSSWKPKKKYTKKPKPNYSYTSASEIDDTSVTDDPRTNLSTQEEIDLEYVRTVLNRLKAPENRHRLSHKSKFVDELKALMESDESADLSGQRTQSQPPPKSSPKFILPPEKRKYYYIKER